MMYAIGTTTKITRGAAVPFELSYPHGVVTSGSYNITHNNIIIISLHHYYIIIT